MSCITQLLAMKGDKEFLPVHEGIVIEGGGIYKNHEYLIVFTDMGHRCGYVALLPEETKDGMESQEPDLECHGGITFFSREHAAKNLLPSPCNDMWVGFDAAHAYDIPCEETVKKYFRNPRERVRFSDNNFHYPWECSHKTYQYMEAECHAIIDQLI